MCLFLLCIDLRFLWKIFFFCYCAVRKCCNFRQQVNTFEEVPSWTFSSIFGWAVHYFVTSFIIFGAVTDSILLGMALNSRYDKRNEFDFRLGWEIIHLNPIECEMIVIYWFSIYWRYFKFLRKFKLQPRVHLFVLPYSGFRFTKGLVIETIKIKWLKSCTC